MRLVSTIKVPGPSQEWHGDLSRSQARVSSVVIQNENPRRPVLSKNRRDKGTLVSKIRKKG
jgi:hypothetical protein